MKLDLTDLNIKPHEENGVILGCEFSDTFTLEDWEEMGRRVGGVAFSINWIIGDWLVKHEDYEKAKLLTRLSYITLRNCKMTAECFPLYARAYKLYFGHHRVIAARVAKDKENWIEKAINENLSVHQLEKAITKAKNITFERPTVKDRHDKIQKWKLNRDEILELIDLLREDLKQLPDGLMIMSGTHDPDIVSLSVENYAI